MAGSGTAEGATAADPRPAPPDLEDLRQFVNSDNRYYGVDALAEEHRLRWCRRWLPNHPVDEIDEDGWRRLVDLRGGIRAVVAREPDAGSALGQLAVRYPMVVDVADAGGSTLRSASGGQEASLAVAMLSALHTAIRDGRAARLRLCERPDCGWCYYDTSRNGSARWCSAEPCGAVMKTRAFRERRRTAG